jgi:hypothetical protein
MNTIIEMMKHCRMPLLTDEEDKLSLSGNTHSCSNYNAVQKDKFCIDAGGGEYRMEWWAVWKHLKHMYFAW